MLPNEYIFHHTHIVEQANILERARYTSPDNRIGPQPNDRATVKSNVTSTRAIDGGD